MNKIMATDKNPTENVRVHVFDETEGKTIGYFNGASWQVLCESISGFDFYESYDVIYWIDAVAEHE